MIQMTKVVCLVLVFLFAFTANFNVGMLINPFDPPMAEAKKKHNKHKKDKDKDKDRDNGKDNDKGKDKDKKKD